MDYETALKLKEAGFPQNLKDGFKGETNFYYDIHTKLPKLVATGSVGMIPIGELIRIPTLSELISACGNKLIALQREDGESTWNKGFIWCAVEEWESYYPPGVLKGHYGNSPEEAVTKLWLALHK